MIQYLFPWVTGVVLASRLMSGRFLRLVLVVAAPMYVLGPYPVSILWPMLAGVALGAWLYRLEQIAPRMAAALSLYSCMLVMGEADAAFIALGGAVLVATNRSFFRLGGEEWHIVHALCLLVIINGGLSL